MSSKRIPLLAALFGLAALAARPAPPTDEEVLAQLWERHIAHPAQHAEFAAAAAEFEQKFPRSPLLPVSQGLLLWHELQAGRTNESARLLTRLLAATGTDPVVMASRDMAKRWLTRLDREQVRGALRAHYTENVAFPATLEELAAGPAASRPPLTDRWGAGWVYQPTALNRLKTESGQSYRLQSTMLGETSDLKTALKIPYASRIALKPVRVVGASGAETAAQFEAGTDRPLLTVGTRQGPVLFAYLGRSILVLNDGDHWRILPRP